MTTKPLTIDLGLDVDGSVTEAMLMKAPRNESPAARWVRLAMLGIVRGCELRAVETARGEVYVGVTSGTKPNTVYRINLDTMHCACSAGHAPCSHKAIALAAIGNLPDPAVYGPRAAALAGMAAETVAAVAA